MYTIDNIICRNRNINTVTIVVIFLVCYRVRHLSFKYVYFLPDQYPHEAMCMCEHESRDQLKIFDPLGSRKKIK